ncbi:hypothetical protein L2W58_00100 [Dethiosulfovibrio sp. F2B]|uniref:Uncharacterized protein n=1 Tax=Dethiosulfovibrio peptidovorans DSM 11002 TaxID=469381 RepID=D2Z3T3_9BACT|nr:MULTISPECIES: hypothetical protein [Dethiosulfovibrio]EFC90389.1 hypothetical protein Dpep_0357 [Dethiosulfovibrio peptidovorans DSM 11002]MCF4150209.1 hypothetical protein [Dethiosulfovibrio faecalis]
MDQVERLARAIDILVEYYPCAFSVLLGEAEPPTDDEWIEIMTRRRLYVSGAAEDPGVRIDRDPDHDGILNQTIALDEVRGVIEKAGWPAIVESARAIKTFFAEDWEIFCLHVRFVTGKTRLGGKSPLQRVADRVGMSPGTVTRKRQEIPMMIARDALKGFQIALKW